MWKAGGHSAAEHRPPGEAVGGELGPLVVVEVEGVESLADGAVVRQARGAARSPVHVHVHLPVPVPVRYR